MSIVESSSNARDRSVEIRVQNRADCTAIQEAARATEALNSCDGLPADEVAHLNAVVARGRDATETLLSRNMGLVYRVINQVIAAGKLPGLLTRDDLEAPGWFAIVDAAKSYDGSASEFSTWATRYISTYITRELDRWRSPMHVPAHQQVAYRRLLAVQIDMGRELERPVSLAEAAERDGTVSPQDVALLERAFTPMMSLDAPFNDDDDSGGSLADVVACPTDVPVDDVAPLRFPRSVFDGLLDVDRDVLFRRYGLFGHRQESVQELAAALDVSRSMIHQRLQRALQRLEEPVRRHLEGLEWQERPQ